MTTSTMIDGTEWVAVSPERWATSRTTSEIGEALVTAACGVEAGQMVRRINEGFVRMLDRCLWAGVGNPDLGSYPADLWAFYHRFLSMVSTPGHGQDQCILLVAQGRDLFDQALLREAVLREVAQEWDRRNRAPRERLSWGLTFGVVAVIVTSALLYRSVTWR